jgi:uncharacterized circularly permuted ATP-grasp superfamily protein/uncharacterized alpha-E superfamily protein
MARTPADARLTSLLGDYRPPPDHFDEVFADVRTLRPHWELFSRYALPLNAESLTRAQARVDRQIHDNGVTFNVYAAADGLARPWTLDALPFIVPPQEWEVIERDVRQRARLLNAIVADLYGRRDLLSDRLLPAPLILQHAGFLRACDGIEPPGRVFLHLVAFDLARGADGRWAVVETRTQAPSGVGYAIENRTTISRLFPEAFRALRVQPLGGFLQGLRRAVVEHAPASGADAPHIVLLTPGPYNETYFEHAYLAKQLGFPLVEGGDLTVRRDRVFVKTVSGLRPVHAILRRLDDDYCDPLELRADSTLGVPGLLQAWRAGQVLVANAFGTSVVQARGLAPFLPAACQRLLGEPLHSVSFGPAESPRLSHAPVWRGGAPAARGVVLRVFAATDSEGGYHVLTGGLARMSAADHRSVSSQRGGGSKDTWVMSRPDAAMLPTAEPRPSRRHGASPDDTGTPSRTAEHLFWLGRYAERSENCARMLRAVLSRLTDDEALPRRLRQVVLGVCVENGLLDRKDAPAAAPGFAPATTMFERMLVEGALDARGHNSLAFNVAQTVRVAAAARDRLSSDNWRLLNRLYQQLLDASGTPIGFDEALEIVDQSIIALVAVGGLEMAHMTRDHGWRFLSIGRHLERLAYVSATLGEVAASPLRADPVLLEWLLDLSDSLVSYRVKFMHHPEWPHVIDLLLLDAQNPRAQVFQLSKLAKHVQLLPGMQPEEIAMLVQESERLAAMAAPVVRIQGELFARHAQLEQMVAKGQHIAAALSDALTLRYFSHAYEMPRTTI